MPLRVHGLLDDASRFVVALEAHSTEREVDMLGLLVRALPPTETAPKGDDRGAARERPLDRTQTEAAARDESRSRRHAAYTEVRRRRAVDRAVTSRPAASPSAS